MKNNRSGQSEIFSPQDFLKVKKAFKSQKYRLLFLLGIYTGERWGAIIQLRVEDVYSDAVKRIPRETITYRASTRKASPDGSRETRQVPVHPELAEALRAYACPVEGWLFPSRVKKGQHICFKTASTYLEAALEKAGLEQKGISTHGTRRTFITRLSEQGVDLHTIQQITGHKSIANVTRYIQANPDRIKKAVASLSVA